MQKLWLWFVITKHPLVALVQDINVDVSASYSPLTPFVSLPSHPTQHLHSRTFTMPARLFAQLHLAPHLVTLLADTETSVLLWCIDF